ncbi:MAG: helix-turn-helix domain-containing protein [Ekhidna sp.]
MKTTVNIKELRNRKGFSQDELAEKSGLSLRTIQRIENGETEPLGDSLKKIASVLDTTPEELIDWDMEENLNFIKRMNLSALFFLLFPLLGIIVPYMIWHSKKGRIAKLDEAGAALINFQITWNILLFFGLIFTFTSLVFGAPDPSLAILITAGALFCLGAYAYNLLMIIINTSLIQKGKTLKYMPSIKFL